MPVDRHAKSFKMLFGCICFLGSQIAWYYLSVYRSVFEGHKPEIHLLFNGRKSWCWHLCTLLFTLHFYWSNLELDLIETADLQKHIHLKKQWKRKICERERVKKENEKRTSEWVEIMTFQDATKDTIEILDPFREVSWTDVEMLWLSSLSIPLLVNEVGI